MLGSDTLGSPDLAGVWACTEGPPLWPVISAWSDFPVTLVIVSDVLQGGSVRRLGLPPPVFGVGRLDGLGCRLPDLAWVDSTAWTAASRNWRGWLEADCPRWRDDRGSVKLGPGMMGPVPVRPEGFV